jgi:hypothetical protein
MSNIIHDDNGKEGLLLHLDSLLRKDIDGLVQSMVERAILVEHNADSHPTVESLKLLVDLLELP